MKPQSPEPLPAGCSICSHVCTICSCILHLDRASQPLNQHLELQNFSLIPAGQEQGVSAVSWKQGFGHFCGHTFPGGCTKAASAQDLDVQRSKGKDLTGQDLSSAAVRQSCISVALCLSSQQGCLLGARLSLCTTMPHACMLVLALSLLTLLFLPLTASYSQQSSLEGLCLPCSVPAVQGESQ